MTQLQVEVIKEAIAIIRRNKKNVSVLREQLAIIERIILSYEDTK